MAGDLAEPDLTQAELDWIDRMVAGARFESRTAAILELLRLGMSDPKAEKKERQAADAKAAWNDYQAQQAATDKNTERLRALRLAHEAQQAAEPPPKKKPKRK